MDVRARDYSKAWLHNPANAATVAEAADRRKRFNAQVQAVQIGKLHFSSENPFKKRHTRAWAINPSRLKALLQDMPPSIDPDVRRTQNAFVREYVRYKNPKTLKDPFWEKVARGGARACNQQNDMTKEQWNELKELIRLSRRRKAGFKKGKMAAAEQIADMLGLAPATVERYGIAYDILEGDRTVDRALSRKKRKQAEMRWLREPS